jgi:hypothetical protein
MNFVTKTTPHAPYWLFASEDTWCEPGSLEKIHNQVDTEALNFVDAQPDWCFVAIGEGVVLKAGLASELFHPLYFDDNDYERKWYQFPDFSRELGKLILFYNAHGFGKSQDIIYDGIWDESLSTSIETNPMRVCIQEPQLENLRFTRFSLMNGEDNIEGFKDYQPFQNCKVEVKTDISSLAGL